MFTRCLVPRARPRGLGDRASSGCSLSRSQCSTSGQPFGLVFGIVFGVAMLAVGREGDPKHSTARRLLALGLTSTLYTLILDIKSDIIDRPGQPSPTPSCSPRSLGYRHGGLGRASGSRHRGGVQLLADAGVHTGPPEAGAKRGLRPPHYISYSGRRETLRHRVVSSWRTLAPLPADVSMMAAMRLSRRSIWASTGGLKQAPVLDCGPSSPPALRPKLNRE